MAIFYGCAVVIFEVPAKIPHPNGENYKNAFLIKIFEYPPNSI
jgi:hypothetical protein